MTYAYVTDGTVQATGRLPAAARRLDTGQWVLGLADAPVELQQACGWYPVTDTPRPDDTATTTHDRTVTLVAGTPTVVWTERPKTQAELDAEAEFAEQQAAQDALPAAARIAVAAQVRADALTDRDITSIAPLFDPWRPGLTVEVGDVGGLGLFAGELFVVGERPFGPDDGRGAGHKLDGAVVGGGRGVVRPRGVGDREPAARLL